MAENIQDQADIVTELDLQDHLHDHDHDHGETCKHHQHNHSHANVTIRHLMFGAVLILSSFIADYIYEDDFISESTMIFGSLVLAVPIITSALKNIFKFNIHMEVLVGLGLLAALVSGRYDEAGLIALFMLIAISLEEKTAHGAQKSIHGLIKLTPSIAHRILSDDTEEDVAARRLIPGDIIRVRPGENFPADGKIVKGISSINQASITGESLPVDKAEGDDVFAGTSNLSGAVEVKVTVIGADTTLGKVQKLIEEAEQTRFPALRLIDEYLGYYTPMMLMLALSVYYFTGDLMQFVYVLVIACPCAVVISTPSAVVAAIASAARLGLLVKNVSIIELAAKVNAVVFDKTGTLTKGELEVSRLSPVDEVELADLLQVAATAEAQSNHPTAIAIRELAKEANVILHPQDTYEEVPGKGVKVVSGSSILYVGRKIWLEELGLNTAAAVKASESESMDAMAGTQVYVAKDKLVLGSIGLRDAIRPEALPAIEELKSKDIPYTAIVSGDQAVVANQVAAKIGIPNVSAECLPEDKVRYVEDLKNKKYTVAVVGDGVNDAPALAAGDISIAMGAIGSDVAINSASIALMNNDLRRVPFVIELSKKTRNIIHMNLLFSVLLIIGGMMLFIFGSDAINNIATMFKINNPGIIKSLFAAFIHIFGTLIIIFNSARLVRAGEHLTLEQE